MNRFSRATGALLAVLTLAAAANADSLRNVKVGQPAPAFRLTTLAGETLSSDDLRGRAVVLVFLSAEQRSSEKAMEQAKEVVRDLRAPDLRLVFATADVARAPYFRTLRDRLNVHEPLLLDFDRSLYGDFGLIVLPTTIVLDAQGRLRHVISSLRSDYADMLAAGAEHALGRIDDAGYEERITRRRFDRDRPAERIARHRAAARTLREHRLSADAEKELRLALAIDADDVETQLDLATLFLAEDRLAEARAIVDPLVRRHPAHRRVHLVHGILLFHADQLDDAERVLEEALLRNPDPVYTHYYLGLVRERRGDAAGANVHFKEALGRLLAERPL